MVYITIVTYSSSVAHTAYYKSMVDIVVCTTGVVYIKLHAYTRVKTVLLALRYMHEGKKKKERKKVQLVNWTNL